MDPGLAGGDWHTLPGGWLSTAPAEAHHCHLHPVLVLERADQGASRVTLEDARRTDKPRVRLGRG